MTSESLENIRKLSLVQEALIRTTRLPILLIFRSISSPSTNSIAENSTCCFLRFPSLLSPSGFALSCSGKYVESSCTNIFAINFSLSSFKSSLKFSIRGLTTMGGFANNVNSLTILFFVFVSEIEISPNRNSFPTIESCAWITMLPRSKDGLLDLFSLEMRIFSTGRSLLFP